MHQSAALSTQIPFASNESSAETSAHAYRYIGKQINNLEGCICMNKSNKSCRFMLIAMFLNNTEGKGWEEGDTHIWFEVCVSP